MDIVDIANEFSHILEEHEKPLVYIAGSYDFGNWAGWEGDAFFLLKDSTTGLLYELHGSHCSCYGLENQWELEETTEASLKHRYDSNPHSHSSFDNAYEQVKIYFNW